MTWKSVRVLLPVLLVGTLLAGCWDGEPISSRLIIAAMAIDAGPQPGTILLTGQSPSASGLAALGAGGAGGAGGGGGGGGGGASASGGPFFEIRQPGTDLAEAIQIARTKVSRDPYYGQVQVVVFGPGLSPGVIQGSIDSLIRLPEMNDQAWAALSLGQSAGSLLSRSSPQEMMPALYLDAFFQQSAATGLDLRQPLWQVEIERVSPGLDPYIPVLDVTPQGFQSNRLALYRDDRMVGVLTPEQTLGWAIAASKARELSIPVTTPLGGADLRALNPRTRIQTRWVEGRPEVVLQTTAAGIVGREPPLLVPSFPGDQNFDQVLRAAVAQRIRAMELDAISASQAVGSDPFGIGSRLYAAAPGKFARLGPWEDAFPSVPIAVQVKVRINSHGNTL